MELRALFREEDAVSSALGVVLMVSVTLVLAAVIGTFVLGIGQDLTDPSPSTNFEFAADVDANDSIPSRVVVLHADGDEFDRMDAEVTIGGDTAYVRGRESGAYTATRHWPQQVTAGNRLELEDDGTRIQPGDVVRIYWSDGEYAAIVGEHRLS